MRCKVVCTWSWKRGTVRAVWRQEKKLRTPLCKAGRMLCGLSCPLLIVGVAGVIYPLPKSNLLQKRKSCHLEAKWSHLESKHCHCPFSCPFPSLFTVHGVRAPDLQTWFTTRGTNLAYSTRDEGSDEGSKRLLAGRLQAVYVVHFVKGVWDEE